MFGAGDIGDALLGGVLLSVLAVAWVILLIRFIGLRSLSKMTSYDFVITLATGSLVAQAAGADQWSGYVQALTAIGALMLLQAVLERARRRGDRIGAIITNEPVLLVREGRFIDRAMRRTRTTRGEVFAKLRAKGIGEIERVSAVILETTGDLSILTDRIGAHVMEDVRRTS